MKNKTGIFSVHWMKLLSFLGNKKAIRKEIALKVKECFDDVEWRKQTFSVTGIGILKSDGEECFYKATEIDKAIKKLNEVLNELSR